MKRLLIRVLAPALALGCALSLCACGKEIPPERVPYLPAQKTFRVVREDQRFEQTFTGDYEWSENACVMTIKDFSGAVSSDENGEAGCEPGDMTVTCSKTGENALRLEYRQGGAGVVYDMTLDDPGRIAAVRRYEASDPGGADVIAVSYPDAYTINVSCDNDPAFDSAITLDRENRIASLTRGTGGFSLQYDHDGNVWTAGEGVDREYVNGGDLKKLVFADASGVADTVLAGGSFTERWQRLADSCIDSLMFGFCSGDGGSANAPACVAAFAVASFVIEG